MTGGPSERWRLSAQDGGIVIGYIGNLTQSLSAPSVQSGYIEQVRRIAPNDLVKREAELAQLAAFCSNEQGAAYAWWRAPAWTGKTALLSWFVLHPPPDVQIVSFFITARLAGQSDRVAFTNVVLEQLAAMLGQGRPF